MKPWLQFEKWLRGCGTLALMALLSGVGSRALAAEQPHLDGTVALQFLQRASEYVRVRNSAVKEVPQLEETTSPVEIAAREKLVANAIRAQRTTAKRGDVFDGAGTQIQALVREDWQERPYAERAALWKEIPRIETPAVNAPYPARLPLATFPPELLAQLPALPEELEYRFAGPHLILLDVEANLVVDVLPNVLSDPGAPRLGAEADQ
jgi:hypothetical protein